VDLILYSIFLFTAIVMLLVAIITVARAKLLPQGDVTIRINRQKELRVFPGDKLLRSLAEHGILLPQACGGAGTCGFCRVRVLAGGGAMLPLERAFIGRRDERRGYRLACQMPVKHDVAVELPPDVFAARRWRCRVRSNRNIATFIKELVLELPAGEEVHFEAGGYIQIEVPRYDLAFRDLDIDARYCEAWEGLRDLESHVEEEVVRAYSMANYPGEKGVLKFNVRIATPPPGSAPGTPPGQASSYLFGLAPGDTVSVVGPFGDLLIHESDAEMVYLGGGAGMAPLRSHLFELLEGRGSQRRISYWYGARSLREAFYTVEFERLAEKHENFRFCLALSEPLPEDEWEGAAGFIHEVAYEQYLKNHPAPEDIEYYLCGPPPMIAAARRMLDDLGVDGENIRYDDFGG